MTAETKATSSPKQTQNVKRSWLFKAVPKFDWLNGYTADTLTDDVLAAIIVTILLVPQALAYALLAGLPAHVGIYAAILPLAVYALIGTSWHLSVGPTAVISLMTAVAIASVPEESRVLAAAMLAIMSGAILVLLGILRAGFIMNFVSRPVVAAYVTGAAILIIFSQLRHILGVDAGGSTALELGRSLWANMESSTPMAFYVGLGTIAFLWVSRKYVAFALYKLGMKRKWARLMARLGPFIAVLTTSVLAYHYDWARVHGLRIVGDIPSGLPSLAFPVADFALWEQLIAAAALISLVGFVDSMSTAQTLAARSRSRIEANREMRALGYANFAAGISGGYPVNGSMSRSAINFSAGARTPVAGLLAAVFMCAAALFLTPYLRYLPLATLAGLIIFACFGLIDFRHLWRTFIYSRADGLTAYATFVSVLLFGVEIAVVVGVVLSMVLHIRSTLRPHAVLVGRFPGTEHYRDVERYEVETSEIVKTLRIHESLYFANARFLEDRIAELLENSPQMTDLILMCPSVNSIDASALNSLLSINKRLESAGVKLHMSEIHSGVLDRLHRSTFFDKLTGQVFFTQHEAMEALEPEPDWSQFFDHVDMH